VVCAERLHAQDLPALDLLEAVYQQEPGMLYTYQRQEVVITTAAAAATTTPTATVHVTQPLIIVMASQFLVRRATHIISTILLLSCH
jgi:hypothetical protein